MLVLYHGGTSTASAKVRLALAEKGLAFESRLLDLRRFEQKSADYLALNPAGVVPTLVHDGAAIGESSIILEYVDETWPQPQLMPTDPAGRARLRLWLRRVDDLHEACSILSSSVKLAALRDDAGAVEMLLARTPDPDKRARQQRLIEQGFDAPEVAAAIDAYRTFCGDAEDALARSAFLSGAAIGLADCAALPYLHRAAVLGMDALWAQTPALSGWIERMMAQPSFDIAIAKWQGAQAYHASAELAARIRA
ncbi:MAG: glutathione S-transferase 2 [Hyphomicrobiales bacterium]|nr:glutathione S-transferase 2 [Hyphomicrobiales bacterium]